MLDLITVGEAFDDFVFYNLRALPRPGCELETRAFVRTSGGGAVITAVAASRLGLRCGIVSALSPDAVARLRAARVSVRNLRRSGEPAAVTVALSTTHDRRYVTFGGINDRLSARLRPIVPHLRARHVHCAFHPRPCRPWVRALERLRQRGITSSWDFGWHPDLVWDRDFRRLCDVVDVLFLNRAEARLYGGIRRWRATPHPVVIKRGASGAWLVGGGFDIRRPAPRARVTDTTGAGDVFDAGFLTARLRHEPLSRALGLANRLAAASTERAGGL